MDNQYKERRQEIEATFANMTLSGKDPETFVSPSGDFELTVSQFTAGPQTWSYSRGEVRRKADHALVADVKRNFDNFWHAWVAHPDGNEYLLCGEDYQGYSVIDLRSGEMAVHFPPEAFKGSGFCWADALPSPDGLTLAVFGCYWACPYELVFFDFSNPMQLPLAELARIGDCYDTVGWESARSFKYVTKPHSSGVVAVWNRP